MVTCVAMLAHAVPTLVKKSWCTAIPDRVLVYGKGDPSRKPLIIRFCYGSYLREVSMANLKTRTARASLSPSRQVVHLA